MTAPARAPLAAYSRLDPPGRMPPLDPEFRPAVLAHRRFRQSVEHHGGGEPLILALERADESVFDCSEREGLQMALMGVFDSQVSGGKRYDLATMGRRRAHATYAETHGVDRATGVAYAMDLTPLIQDPGLDIGGFLQAFIDRFAADVRAALRLAT